MIKMMLTDLDGTLLRSDRTISEETLQVLKECREQGMLIGISTARGENNTVRQIREMEPDVVISSSGALIRYYEKEKWGKVHEGRVIHAAKWTAEETNQLIRAGLEHSEGQCEITVDSLEGYYWNYKVDPTIEDPDWGETNYTDYSEFNVEALKLCMWLEDPELASRIAGSVEDCECQRFSGGNWYKFTRKGNSKADAVRKVSEYFRIPVENIVAFGDDVTDAEMLSVCGYGVAVANAVPKAKEVAGEICLSNDEDGVAKWLRDNCL